MELDAALRKGFRLGDWEVRPIEGLVTGAEGSHHLQPKTMDVLVCLAASPGQVVTRDEIIERVWNGSARARRGASTRAGRQAQQGEKIVLKSEHGPANAGAAWASGEPLRPWRPSISLTLMIRTPENSVATSSRPCMTS